MSEKHEKQNDPEKPTGLALLRVPFKAGDISKLPKPTAKKEVMEKLPKAKCNVCGKYHATSKVIHLDYVGHAALTNRLLDCDPEWNWEPMATHDHGGPMLDSNGGLWIKLTVCGVTRLGYGHADGKSGGDAVKEVIGDALRNAAMRFGAALDLWHKGDLHADDDEPISDTQASEDQVADPHAELKARIKALNDKLEVSANVEDLQETWTNNEPFIEDIKGKSKKAHDHLVKTYNETMKRLSKSDCPF